MFKEYSKVMGYIVMTLVTLSLVFGGLRLAGVLGERVAFENSFQYSEGMKSRKIVLQSQIAQIDADIVNNPDKFSSLQAQRKVLEIQLQAAQ